MSKAKFIGAAIVLVSLLTTNSSGQEYSSLSISGSAASPNQGVWPFVVWEGESGPKAVFGLYQKADQQPQFGYMILFQPSDEPEQKKATSKSVQTDTTETRTDSSLELKWDKKQIKLHWKFDTKQDHLDLLTINDEKFDRAKRIFLARHNGEKFEVTAVESQLPKSPGIDDCKSTENLDAVMRDLKTTSPAIAKFLNR